MSTLVEISEDLMVLDRLIEDSAGEDGEINDEVAAQLDKWFAELMQDRNRKMDNYGALVREMELRATARQEEIDRLAVRVRVDKTNAKYLKQRLLEFLDAHKLPKVETRRYKFTCCGNGGLQPMIIPDDPTTLPTDLQKTTITANLEKIREQLACGNKVSGCELLPRGRHLRIK